MCYYRNFHKSCFENKFWVVRGNFGEIIDIVMRKLCCLRIYLENVGLNIF
jgi:hypothetical protein